MISPQLSGEIQRLCFAAIVPGSYCWQHIAIWLCTWMLDRQDSIVWSGQTWWLLVFLEVFSLCRHVRPDFALPYEKCTEHEPTCCTKQYSLSPSHFSRVHMINTNCSLVLIVALALHFGVPDTCYTHSLWQKLKFLHLPLMILFLYSLLQSCTPFSCNLILPLPAWEKGWVITWGLRAGWLPLIE